MRIAVRKLLYAYNNTPPANFPDGAEPKLEVTGSDRRDLLAKIFHLKDGHEAKIEVEPPLWLDYGCNVKFEGSFYCNFNATILDCAEVIIGDGVLFGPNVHLYGGTHSVNPAERKSVLERALPIKIGENCWMAGVTIGKNVTI
ncbi:uncharacterized protein MJAP1_002566 [Malassezia japonica]|uniref:Acetyltransferase n=1 Tax=Malassezia japonica TaxID=223818 RepID=A0AAF0JG49_9BASI|nr:uncharacterized protein MJAP1_002566 [Malassezia japonica]WFD39586.1 hypothetical protein MJAP1_002566 [Malassezia japonica]